MFTVDFVLSGFVVVWVLVVCGLGLCGFVVCLLLWLAWGCFAIVVCVFGCFVVGLSLFGGCCCLLALLVSLVGCVLWV